MYAKSILAYRLDPASASFFRTSRLRLLARNQYVVGRLGRYGTVSGKISDRFLSAVWHDVRGDRRGWLAVVFSAQYGSFEGSYAQEPAGSVCQCFGRLADGRRVDPLSIPG